MRRVSISEMKSFWECPARWYLKYVNPKRSPVGGSASMTIGTIWHSYLETLLRNQGGTGTYELAHSKLTMNLEAAMAEASNLKVWDDLRKQGEMLTAAAPLWNDWLECETLATELPMSIVVATKYCPVEIVGRVDRIVRMQTSGRIALVNHKTIAGTKAVEPYISTFAYTPHEAAYWLMARQKFNEDPWGTILNLLRKLSPKTIRDMPQTAIQQHPIPIDREIVDRSWENILETLDRMMEIESIGKLPYRNPDRDLNVFGGYPDPYFEFFKTLDHDVLMNDEKFKDTEDRYDDLVSE